MAEIPDVAGGETITSAFTNNVKNRTVMRYANQAALDASIPVPIEGDMAFLQAENDVVFYANGAWFTVFTVAGGTINGALAVTGTTTGVRLSMPLP